MEHKLFVMEVQHRFQLLLLVRGPWSGTLSNGASFSGATSPIAVSVSPSSNTTITIATLSDSNCSADAGDLSGSAVITVNARPTGVIGGTQTVCAGSSASLYINVTGSGTFNGTLSPGAIPFSGSGPMIVVSVTALATTTYTIATLSGAIVVLFLEIFPEVQH